MNEKESLPRLTEKTNFSNWKFRIGLLMEEKGVSYTLKEDSTDTKDDTKFTKDDAKARSIIVQCLSDKHLEIVKQCKNAKGMLDQLRDTFERKSIFNKLHLKKKLITIKCGDSERLQDFYYRFDAAVSDVKATGCEVSEEDQVCQLISAMPPAYEGVITSIETLSTEKTLTLEFTKARLLDAEIKVNQTKSETVGESSSFLCYSCNKPGHIAADCQKQQYHWNQNYGRGQHTYGQNQQFQRYGQQLHARGGQPHFGRGQPHNGRGRSFRGRGRTNYQGRNYGHSALQDNGMSFTACSAYSLTSDINKCDIRFVIDSGATEHLLRGEHLGDATDVMDLDNEIKIYVANGQYLTSKKRGNLKVKFNDICITICCLIVENLSHNLLSVQKLIEKNLNVNFSNNSVSIYDEYHELCGQMLGKLYIIDFKLNLQQCMSSSTHDDLWHQRLGHANRKHLAILKLPYSNTPCGPCMEGKATRLPFQPIKKPMSRYTGEFLHTDLSGPVPTPTNEGEVYFHSIIDDYSHFCVVFLLKKKSEATEKLTEYINFLETQTGNKIKKIRCDNGGEFKNYMLQNYCNKKGIQLQFTIAYSPQSNGIAERMNRTIYNKARTLMIETGLPKHLWGEAVRCAVHQINRCPSSAINYEIPAEIRFGESNLTKLKVFGSKAWVVQVPKQGKFEKRAKEMRFVGYTINGYRLWDPKEDQIVISRDVRFDETQIQFKGEEKHNIYMQKDDEEYLEDDEYEKEDDIMKKNDQTRKKAAEEKENYQQKENYETTMPKDTEIYNEDSDSSNEKEIKLQETGNPPETRTRSGRLVKKPGYLLETEKENKPLNDKQIEHELNVAYCLLTGEPQNYEEAIKDEEWKEAINKELNAHSKLETWKEAILPKGEKAIDTKWIFRLKQDGTKKARIVAKGFQQNGLGQTYYSPVARVSTIRTILSHAVQENLKIKQLDVPTAFLNGKLEDDVYIKYPKGLESNKGNVLKLNKALYGLKEAPKCWNKRFHDFMIKNGFEQSKYDFCLYKTKNTWLLIFVDDILILGEEEPILMKLRREFKVKDLGEVQDYLGLEISRKNNIMEIKQKKMIERTLEKFNMQQCKGVATPMESHFTPEKDEKIIDVPFKELIGCLLFISTNSRPDISYAVSYLSRYLDKPTESLWKAGKRILRYLKATANKGLVYYVQSNQSEQLIAYSDADWAGDKTDRKSTSGCVIFYCGNPIHWYSKKQTSVALSTAEAEYVAGSIAVSELIYLKGIVTDLTLSQDTIKTNLLIDNQSAIRMIESFENSKRSKHIDIRAHFIKDIISKKIISVYYIQTDENVSDIFTKALPTSKHAYFLEKLKLK